MSDTKEDQGDDEKIYGGCEGPDAMFVKLVSSDGHEFIVKRDHALTSGTIKAMLSGPGNFDELFTFLMVYSHCTGPRLVEAVQGTGLAQEETMGPSPVQCEYTIRVHLY